MDNLKKLRKEKGLTQDKVAADLGMSTIMYSYIEQGRRRPSDRNKIRIANYYGVSVQEIFFDTDIAKSNKKFC